MAERTPTDLERQLHDALRHAVIEYNPVASDWWWAKCHRCKAKWKSTESHGLGCLAAPDALKGDEHE